MTILTIITAPDPRLRVISEPVDQISNKDKTLMNDMLETMYSAPGVGLSAIQVGIAKRIIVIDTAGQNEKPEPLKIINPKFISKSETTEIKEEGCLSFPEHYVEVKRSKNIKIECLNENGDRQYIEASGFKAIALQHEIDHLDGKLLIDNLSSLKRSILLRKMKKHKNNNN